MAAIIYTSTITGKLAGRARCAGRAAKPPHLGQGDRLPPLDTFGGLWRQRRAGSRQGGR